MGAPGPSLPSIDVVAAVLRNRQGRVLIAERPAGKPLVGFWEFPGGKLEAAELPLAALKRELHEELGIEVQGAYRLLRYSYNYPERHVRLDVWRVTQYAGAPTSREGQALAWVAPRDMGQWKLLPADGPIVTSLILPPFLLVTPEPDDEERFLRALRRSLEAGVDFVQFRAPGFDERRYALLARHVVDLCRDHGARVHLNSDPATARDARADGVHLSQALLKSLGRHWDKGDLTVGISCHSAEEFAQAMGHRPDYITLGSVTDSASHPGVPPLGWERFAEIAASSPVPVYAIGGMGLGDAGRARESGGHGIAAIRTLWDLDQFPESS